MRSVQQALTSTNYRCRSNRDEYNGQTGAHLFAAIYELDGYLLPTCFVQSKFDKAKSAAVDVADLQTGSCFSLYVQQDYRRVLASCSCSEQLRFILKQEG